MPTVGVYQDALVTAFGEEVTEKGFDELCFEFGLELDEVTNEYEMALKERGPEAAEGLSKRTIYKVDVPANRYDLLCLEGLVIALQVFKKKRGVPVYSLSQPRPKANMQVTVKASAAQIRPYVVAAVLRGVSFDADRYQSFIDLQDKLHMNICRRRTLASIGTHDLSTLKPPFVYEARKPSDIHFVPLGQTEEMDGHRMMEVLSSHQQLKAYLPIIRDAPLYPVITDANGIVASLPPIINGEHSKIRLETKDIFVEVTACDLTKANITLNTVCANFSQYCTQPFAIEPVEVIYESDYPANTFTKGGDRIFYPKVETRETTADIGRMKNSLGLGKLSSEDVAGYIRDMSMEAEVNKRDPNKLHVQVPITRSDIMHECDLIEDLAIAYGYNNLTQVVPETLHWPAEQPIGHLMDLVRKECAMAGFNECYNWGLCSGKDNYDHLRREPKPEELWRTAARPNEYLPGAVAVSVGNPKAREFEILRTSLLPGIIKNLMSNKHNPPPIRLFEVGDVVYQDPTRETGAKNQRMCAGLLAGKTPDFEKIHGLLDQVMYALNCCYEHEKEGKTEYARRTAFKLEPSEDPAFLPGRQAHVMIDGLNIGVIGVLHPETMRAFDVPMPASAFEINIEIFLATL